MRLATGIIKGRKAAEDERMIFEGDGTPRYGPVFLFDRGALTPGQRDLSPGCDWRRSWVFGAE
jgi:hypothetical protein